MAHVKYVNNKKKKGHIEKSRINKFPFTLRVKEEEKKYNLHWPSLANHKFNTRRKCSM